jgi:hypothetical protein
LDEHATAIFRVGVGRGCGQVVQEGAWKLVTVQGPFLTVLCPSLLLVCCGIVPLHICEFK